MVLINGIRATAEDLQTLKTWLSLGKIEILFFRRGDYYTNILTT